MLPAGISFKQLCLVDSNRLGMVSKKVVGAQFAEACDSISANIAEGFGRHFKKDKI